jgi:hypothetical protein
MVIFYQSNVFKFEVIMKKSAVVLSILLNLTSLSVAFGGSKDVTPRMNECSPVMDSKTYMTTEFHSYPRTVVFECSYKCNSNGKIETVKGITRVTVSNMEDDASGTTCQGVLMKKVAWGYDFDKVQPFYAPETGILELKRWAFQNVNFDPKVNLVERDRLVLLKKDLYTISASFIVAGMNGGAIHFNEAGLKLSKIADNLPLNTVLLDEVIQQIVVNKGKSGVVGTSESLIYSMISSAAAWKIPTHLYK